MHTCNLSSYFVWASSVQPTREDLNGSWHPEANKLLGRNHVWIYSFNLCCWFIQSLPTCRAHSVNKHAVQTISVRVVIHFWLFVFMLLFSFLLVFFLFVLPLFALLAAMVVRWRRRQRGGGGTVWVGGGRRRGGVLQQLLQLLDPRNRKGRKRREEVTELMQSEMASIQSQSLSHLECAHLCYIFHFQRGPSTH